MAMATDKTNQRLLKRAEKAAGQGVTFTPEAIARLKELEVAAQAEMANDEGLQLRFAQIDDFLKQWALLSPDKQEELGKRFQEQANTLVDATYDRQTQELKDSLDRKLSSLGSRYGFKNESDRLTLQKSLRELDRDTVERLTSAMNDVESRGLGNSGMFTQIATSIMEGRQQSINDAIDAIQVANKQAISEKNAAADELQIAAEADQRTIDENRTVAREVKKNELVDRAVQRDLLSQIMTGATDITPRPSDYKPNIPAADTVPNEPITTESIRTTRSNESATAPRPGSVTAQERRNIRLSRMQQ